MATYRTILSLIMTLFLSTAWAGPQRMVAQEKATTIPGSDENHLPAQILQMENFYTHHVIIVEKSTHKLYLYENAASYPKLIKTYQIATGKKPGNKTSSGDFRTPEGVYYFTDFISHNELLKKLGKEGEIYGIGAFVMNYPNPFDNQEKKSGGGIWLHSTNDETRIDKGLDSRGCVVAANNDLKEIAQFVELDKTNIVIVHDVHFLREETWKKSRDGIQKTLDGWANAWRKKDFQEYLSYYDPADFKDPVRGNFPKFKKYKQAVFSNPGFPEINLYDVSMVQGDSYAVVTFTQKYKSNTINDTGKKLLYMRKDDGYEWKIIAEIWAKLPTGANNVAERKPFTPSARFFKN